MIRVSLLASFVALVLGLCASMASGQDEAGVYTKFDKNPAPVRTPPPQVPGDLTSVNGLVAVVVVIDETGTVTQASVAKSSNPGFEQASLEAIRKWKFKPAEVGGQPVKAKVTIPFHFNAS